MLNLKIRESIKNTLNNFVPKQFQTAKKKKKYDNNK